MVLFDISDILISSRIFVFRIFRCNFCVHAYFYIGLYIEISSKNMEKTNNNNNHNDKLLNIAQYLISGEIFWRVTI